MNLVRRIRRARWGLSDTWDSMVGAAYVAGCFFDLATRRRVNDLEKRIEVIELERKFLLDAGDQKKPVAGG